MALNGLNVGDTNQKENHAASQTEPNARKGHLQQPRRLLGRTWNRLPKAFLPRKMPFVKCPSVWKRKSDFQIRPIIKVLSLQGGPLLVVNGGV